MLLFVGVGLSGALQIGRHGCTRQFGEMHDQFAESTSGFSSGGMHNFVHCDGSQPHLGEQRRVVHAHVTTIAMPKFVGGGWTGLINRLFASLKFQKVTDVPMFLVVILVTRC